jgi:hypothetical protein
MAEQEDLEHQLNNVSDDDLLLNGDDGSELEESELSVNSNDPFYFCKHSILSRQQKLRAISCQCKMIVMKKMSVQLTFHVMKMILIQMVNLEQNIFVFMKNYPHHHGFGIISFLYFIGFYRSFI